MKDSLNMNEFLLTDRIQKIKSINEQYDLVNRAYISFSGGKDSTVVHHLIDMALPGNSIPRVFINTGIEYKSIYTFVQRERERDSRFVFIQPQGNIREILDKYGYPFKSKEHSCKLLLWKNGCRTKSVIKYLERKDRFACPKKLRYQFLDSFGMNISDKCCYKMKKEPVHRWERENERPIAILGVRMDEGGQRKNHSECIVLEGDSISKFKPLNPMSDEWIEWFINKHGIELCELYYPPFNFKRTGCKGCPFSLDLKNQLDVMSALLPSERKQCELIWKPVYEEYRRIGYRLKDGFQLELF